jgi:hypothetical protein
MDCFCRDTSSANAMIRKLASGKYRLYSRKKIRRLAAGAI